MRCAEALQAAFDQFIEGQKANPSPFATPLLSGMQATFWQLLT
jgi:hypothetical protein